MPSEKVRVGTIDRAERQYREGVPVESVVVPAVLAFFLDSPAYLDVQAWSDGKTTTIKKDVKIRSHSAKVPSTKFAERSTSMIARLTSVMMNAGRFSL